VSDDGDESGGNGSGGSGSGGESSGGSGGRDGSGGSGGESSGESGGSDGSASRTAEEARATPEHNGHGIASKPTTATAGDDAADPEFGEAWVYESIVSALPGANLSGGSAIALQLGVFLGTMLVVAAAYDLWNAVVPGTAAIAVAAVGSYFMLQLGETNRTLAAPRRYYRLLFGSSIEVVLAVLAFVALITHLFVFEPRFVGEPSPLAALLPVSVGTATEPLLFGLLGAEPPIVAVYLTLLVLWDLCYRIGTSWWAAVVSLYRELRVPPSEESAARFRRLDLLNVGFAVTQAALLPFIVDRPVLLVAVSGHIVAVTVVSGAALAVSLRRS
jgi:hypothetical protein